ncbi:MAG TPA: hypothetical protein VKP10_12280 [Gemmatimonadales bacterium]|nr:hypothetical protein [Gemmatimonadales bacterium]
MMLLALIATLTANAPLTPDTARLAPVCRRFIALDAARIWPGFRPDTLAVAFVVPERGTMLCNWRGTPPDGFTALGAPGLAWIDVASRSAANTNAELAGRHVAQLVAQPDATPAQLVYLAAHEAFHVFERGSRREGKRFGGGENAFLVTSYPVFDRDNEAGFALEARVLAAALQAPGDSAARALAWEFLALRDARQRALGADGAEFERMAELNEGLAEYAGLRAVQVGPLDPAWRDGASRVVARVTGSLDSVTTQSRNSLRLRFYATGPALARLLDRLAGERWKADLVREDRTVQEELAAVTGYGVREARLIAAARARFDWPALAQSTAATIAGLESLRRAQRDSILAAPGIELVIDASAVGGMGTCGIDPQNLLQAGQGALLHRRWVRPCAGKALDAEFTTPVVQDQQAGTVRAVIGDETTLRWTASGTPLALPDGARLGDVRDLRLDAPLVTVQAAHVAVERSGRTVIVRLLPAS